MTPAEKLATQKRRQRSARNTRNVRKASLRTPLRELRESHGLAMRDVARACGLSLSAYWQIEGGGDLVVTNALRIARFYGKPVEELWTHV